jgi:hypothetical protein
MEKQTKIAIAIIVPSVIFIGIILVVLAKLKNDTELLKMQKEKQTDIEYALCKDDALTAYSSIWDSECAELGRDVDCSLPGYKVTRLDALLEKSKKECFDVYKLKLQ